MTCSTTHTSKVDICTKRVISCFTRKFCRHVSCVAFHFLVSICVMFISQHSVSWWCLRQFVLFRVCMVSGFSIKCHITFMIMCFWADCHVSRWRGGGWRSWSASWTVAFPKLRSRSSECGSWFAFYLSECCNNRSTDDWMTRKHSVTFRPPCFSNSCTKLFSDFLRLLFRLENCLDGIEPNSSY